MLPNKSEFRILLDTRDIILHGDCDESAGYLLKGTLLLKCHERMKIKSIVLAFQGSIFVSWTEAEGSHLLKYKADRVLLEKEWIFLEPRKKTYSFIPGHYEWNFEIVLPGHLPGSIEHGLGQVCYTFRACCRRNMLTSNLIDRQSVKISRLLYAYDSSVTISNVWLNKVSYNISIPQSTYNINTMIPISFALNPLDENLKIHGITCILKEYTTFRVPGHERCFANVMHTRRDEYTKEKWSITELVHVPASTHVDIQEELIQVKHKLKFIVSFGILELRVSIPITVTAVIPEENELPAYHETLKSLPSTTNTVSYSAASQGSLPTYESIQI